MFNGSPTSSSFVYKSQNLIAVSLIAALTVLVIYFVNLNAIQRPAEQAKNNYWEQEAKYSTENASLVCPPSKQGQPISSDICQRQDHYRYDRQHQIADHKAQVHVRNATFLGLIIGISGLILLSWTLDATKDAAKAAFATLDIAKKTLAETEKANQRGQRAYLGIESVNIESFGESQPIEISIRVQNYGNSPARLIRSIVGGGMFDVRGDNDEELEVTFEQVISENNTTIGSSKIINSGADRIFKFGSEERIDDQFSGFHFGNNQYLIAAKFTYRDVFGFTYDFVFRGNVLPFHHEVGAPLNCIEETEAY